MAVSVATLFYLTENTAQNVKRANEIIKKIIDREYLLQDKAQLEHADFFDKIVGFIQQEGVRAVRVSGDPSTQELLKGRIKNELEVKYIKITKAKMQKATEKFIKEFSITINRYKEKIEKHLNILAKSNFNINNSTPIPAQTIELFKFLIVELKNDLKCLKKLKKQALELNSENNIFLLEDLIKKLSNAMNLYLSKIPTLEDPIQDSIGGNIKRIFSEIFLKSDLEKISKTTGQLLEFLFDEVKKDLESFVPSHGIGDQRLLTEIKSLLTTERNGHCKIICKRYEEKQVEILCKYIYEYMNLSSEAPAHIESFMNGANLILLSEQGGGAGPSDQ